MIDEKAEDLGTHLMLSPWLESTHKDLEKSFLSCRISKKESEDVMEYLKVQ
jgi:hypothetical protein